jgi:branched-chain amino acid transport system permease protein
LASYATGAVAGGIAGAAFAIHVSGVLPDRFRFDISITLLAMVVLGGMGNVWGVTIGALVLAWTNSTGLPRIQGGLEESGSATAVGIVLLIAAAVVVAAGIALLLSGRSAGLFMIYLGGVLAIIGAVLVSQGTEVNFQFFVFGSVLIMMMLFRREGLIPEARTRLVLREPGRTEAEALGADMEDVAPELESLPDDTVHAGGSVPPAESSGIEGTRS